jgi:outer membrane protein TolC
MKSRPLLSTAACLTLAGCAIKNPPAGSNILTSAAREQIPANWSGSHRSGAVAPGWIRTFRDPELTRIVEEAIARNPDLKAAAARVEASRYAVRVAASSLYPRIAGKILGNRQGMELGGDLGSGVTPPGFGGIPGIDDGGGSSQDTSLESSTRRWVYGLGIGAAWEADVWGRVRSKKAAAQAESDALAYDYEFARQSLAAAVANAYFTTIEAAQQAANAQEILSYYSEASRLADVRKEQGHASDFDLSQIRARTASAQDALYVAQAARAQAIRAIEVVTSHYPSGRLATRSSFPGQPRAVPAGLPSQLLELLLKGRDEAFDAPPRHDVQRLGREVEHQPAHPVARIVQQFGCPHRTGNDDGIGGTDIVTYYTNTAARSYTITLLTGNAYAGKCTLNSPTNAAPGDAPAKSGASKYPSTSTD